jgi:hypothetical protein
MIGKAPNNSGKKVLLIAWISRLVCIVLTLSLLPVGCSSPTLDLTGTWRADDQAYYYIRQLGASVWWAGLGGDHGLSYTNVFRGTIQPQNSNIIIGTWTDVPRGTKLRDGTLTLNIQQASNGIELRKGSQTGGFGPSVWTKVLSVFPDITYPNCDIYCRYDGVLRRNNDGSMHDHLKMYKDNVSIYGTIYDNFHVNWRTNPSVLDPTYQNFMCGPDEEWDGDISFDVGYDLSPTPPDFWTPSKYWLNNPDDIHKKLRYEFRNSVFPGTSSLLHAEAIMYGKKYSYITHTTLGDVKVPDCSGNTPTLLPGWMETGRNSVQLDGGPVNDGRSSFNDIQKLFGRLLKVGASVRLRGFLALDCHGFDSTTDDILDPSNWSVGCKNESDNEHNVEIHPVYAIDVIQDFGHNRSPYATLTGVWGGNNVDATYYVRQLGDIVWWLGLSSDDGINDGFTFATVFRGRIQPDTALCQRCNKVVGDWADVPLGMRQQSGTSSTAGGSFCASYCTSVGPVGEWNKFSFTTRYHNGWEGPDLRKLYDVVVPCDVDNCANPPRGI